MQDPLNRAFSVRVDCNLMEEYLHRCEKRGRFFGVKKMREMFIEARINIPFFPLTQQKYRAGRKIRRLFIIKSGIA